jgi:DNA primase
VRLTASQREYLERAVTTFQKSIDLAGEYLTKRGIGPRAANTFRLGVVGEELAGFEQYLGRLAIPYLTKTGVIDIRFRAMGPEQPKYLGMAGANTHLYNVLSVLTAQDSIAVCEGEIDALTLHHNVGIPCVGVPGANNWKRHYSKILADFETVYVFADGDQAGADFAKRMAKELQGVRVIQMPEGEDVNSMYTTHGADWLRGRITE